MTSQDTKSAGPVSELSDAEWMLSLAELIARLRDCPKCDDYNPLSNDCGECPSCLRHLAAARLEAFHAKPVVGEEWRDIATAPRDATEFIAWSVNENGVGFWNGRCRFCDADGPFEIWGRIDYDEDGWDVMSHVTPTHWRPDLAPPAALQSPPPVVSGDAIAQAVEALKPFAAAEVAARMSGFRGLEASELVHCTRGDLRRATAAIDALALVSTPPLVEEGRREAVKALLNASPDEYWQAIETEVKRAGKSVTHASLLNHQAAHLLAWADIARNAALSTPATAQGDVREALEPIPADPDEAMGWRACKQGVGLAECKFSGERRARWETGHRARSIWKRGLTTLKGQDNG